MKMITAIINSKDINRVCQALTDAHFEFTKLSTTGGFLKIGNTTLLMGIEDEKLDDAIAIIRKNSAKRVEKIPAIPPSPDMPAALHNPYPAEVAVGGAIVFVTEVTYFERM
jgi:uncharacterized protein YaaQ